MPRIDANITTLGPIAINALRSAMFAVEQTLGVNVNGSAASLASFLSVSFNLDGTLKPAALVAAGLIYLPIVDSEISPTAAIQESKLALTYSTASLYDLYVSLNNAVEVLNGWLSLIGIQVAPHIAGTAYNHELSAIFVDTALPMLKTNPVVDIIGPGTAVQDRNTTNADTLIADISNDLITHEKANGTPSISPAAGGNVPPSGFAHNSTGLYVDPADFTVIPQTIDSVQELANYLDSSLLFFDSRLPILFSDGIPNTSRSQSLANDGYGSPLVPPTPVIAYLLGVPPGPISSTPVDNINDGDDVILLQPTAAQLANGVFEAQFAQVQPGDVITINYDNNTGISYQFVIDSISQETGGTYSVRINGKNLFSTDGYGSARIDQSLFQRAKYGVLTTAGAPNQFSALETLIIANPRSAVALGNGYDATGFDGEHYNLYLVEYPYGDPTDGYLIQLPAIDMTGNKGATPGLYTLDYIVATTNAAFRAAGYNYRFIAFEFQGNIGIMLADPYNNASFSIVGGSGVNTSGTYTYGSGFSNASATNCRNNIVDNPAGVDPCGFGLTGSNVATPPPPPIFTYPSSISATLAPTVIFYPLTSNYYMVNGTQTDRLRSDPLAINQIADQYGDGYWPGSIYYVQSYSNGGALAGNPGGPGHIQTSYIIELGLETSGLEIGKTLVVQPNAFLNADGYTYNSRDYGRFLISNVQFYNCNTANAYTVITVFDAVHGVGSSPASVSQIGTPVNIYFDDDSVSFDAQNIFGAPSYPYRRYFEIYIDQNGHSFSHERGRFPTTGLNSIGQIEFVSISPKLRGYPGTTGTSIRLQISGNGFDATTGIFSGQLGRYDASNNAFTNLGPFTFGKKGETVRFYDETTIDFIDFKFDLNASTLTFTSATIDIQLFPSLQGNDTLMCISSCQVDDNSKQVSVIEDLRQFGNVSEEQFSTSALDYIAASDKLLRENGVIQGFDLVLPAINSGTGATITAAGGSASPVLSGISGVNDSDVGQYVVISGAGHSSNDGTFLITSVPTSTSLIYSNPSIAVSDTANWSITANPGRVSINGGTALIEGNILNINNQVIDIPVLEEVIPGLNNSTTGWYVCASCDGEIQLIASTTLYSTSPSQYTASALDQNRLFNVINPNTTNPSYKIRATYLENLILNFNDLTPLYFVSATIAPASSGFAVSFSTIPIDIRRYIAAGINGLTNMVLAPDGNFRSVQGLNYWLKELTASNAILDYLSETQTTTHLGYNVIVKGDWFIDDYNGQFGGGYLPITYTGDGGTFIIPDTVSALTNTTYFINIGSNLTFRNIHFENEYDAPDNRDPNWISSYPSVLSNYSKGCLYAQLTNPDTVLQNITIDNCLFTSSITGSTPGDGRFPFIVIDMHIAQTLAQNINITNNQFFTSLTNDQLSVISIVDTASPSSPVGLAQGTRLIDCHIDNNTCNQSQLIVLSTVIHKTLDPNLLSVKDAIVPINCSISGNICGAIDFAVAEDIPNYPGNNGSNIPSPTFYNYAILDKENLLTIAKNNCKFIYLGAADGSTGRLFTGSPNTWWFVVDAFSSVIPGSVSIYDNVCSWIHAGACYTGNSLLFIRNNKITAFDPTFLTNYYSGTTVSAIPAVLLTAPTTINMNTAIFLEFGNTSGGLIINPNAIDNYGFNVLVAGNVIQAGNATLSSGGGVASYLYSSAFMTIGVTTTLQDNVFSGVGNGSTSPGGGTNNMLNIYGALCKITGNSLVRGSQALASYIMNSTQTIFGGLDLYVVGNIFDYSTIDGLNIYPLGPPISSYALLAGGLTTTSTYIQNINQTNTTTIALTDYVNYQSFANISGVLAPSDGPAVPEIFENTVGINNAIVADPSITGVNVQVLRASTGTASNVGASYLQIYTPANSPILANFISMTFPIDTTLPVGVKIVSAQMGVWLQDTPGVFPTNLNTNLDNHNQITLALVAYNNTQTSNGYANGILDVFHNITQSGGYVNDNAVAASNTFTVIITSGTPSSTPTYSKVTETEIANATQYCTITPNYGTYATGNNYRITAEVNINYFPGTYLPPLPVTIPNSGPFNFVLSPIVITYRW